MANIILTEITIKMLLESGLVEPGTIIYSDTKPVKTAKINSDGLISIDIDGQNNIGFHRPGGIKTMKKSIITAILVFCFFLASCGEAKQIGLGRIMIRKQKQIFQSQQKNR